MKASQAWGVACVSWLIMIAVGIPLPPLLGIWWLGHAAYLWLAHKLGAGRTRSAMTAVLVGLVPVLDTVYVLQKERSRG